ncbi:XTP/dITP diphosphatase [Eremococcus coleocola]|uniref:XTP/dITP diphosphatase n=1 Tax=Eremococcus coleocola TaxID=88132 RepID=UPI0003FD0605|nr:XTP/dITP diphosphatase [Eremococcus coleocola]
MKLVIASHNQHKVVEIKNLLKNFGLEVTSLADYPEIGDIEETGTTFEANARLKAEPMAAHFGTIVLADDSGLVVDALDGAPGVYSARYAGESHDDHANNLKLLDALKDVHGNDRSAHFVSCLVLAYPGVESLVVQGQAPGQILEDYVADPEAFGYDPIFYVPEEGATFAQLPIERKNQISHRAHAFQNLVKVLPAWLEEVKKYENACS